MLRPAVMKRFFVVLLAGLLVYGCVALQQTEDYHKALKEGRYADAYRILKKLCDDFPSYYLCKDLDEVALKYANQRLQALKASIEEAEDPLPLDRLEGFEAKLKEVLKISPSVDSSAVEALLKKKREISLERIDTLEGLAYRAGRAGELKKALEYLSEVVRLDPSKKGIVEDYREKRLSELYEEAKRAEKAERWTDAHRILRIIYEVEPSYRDVKEALSLAKKRDSYGYHIEEAKKAYRAKDYQRARRFAELALTYKNSKEARELLYSLLSEHTRRLFRRGVELYNEDLLLSAGATFLEAITQLKRLPYHRRKKIALPSAQIKSLVDEMVIRAKEEWQKGDREIAYLYMDILSRIEPSHPEVLVLKEEWKEEVENLSLPTLAVIPFRGPSYNVDAGSMISTRILHYIYNELARDVKILERSAMEAIIKEKEVKALQGGELKGDILKLIGADYLIIGNVTDYRVENALQNNFKILRAKVGTRRTLNPEYEEWIAKGRIGDEPPKYIDEPIFEKVKYKIVHHKKIASVAVGWRVVDSNGNIIYVDVVEKKAVESAEGREGVSVGDVNIEEKLPELPTDSELLKRVEDQVVEEISNRLKQLFSNYEEKLLKRAQTLKNSGNLRKALAELVKARFVAESKGADRVSIKAEMEKILAEGVI